MAKRGNHSRSSGGSPAAKAILLVCVLLVMIVAGSTLFSGGDDARAQRTAGPAASGQSLSGGDGHQVTPDEGGGNIDATAGQGGATPSTGAQHAGNTADGTAAGVGANSSVTVPANAAVDDSYFDDAIFVGDSRTEGLKMYSGLPTSIFWSKVGLTVDTAFTDRFVVLDNQWLTVAEALRQASYSKVYIMLGMNELGWVYESVFAEDYGKIIDVIKESHPDATIYVQSIIPVSQWKDSSDETRVYTNANVVRLQKVLVEMCEEKGVNYVNVAEVMQDENGYLFSEATLDGMHLTPEYCKIWLEYLKTHTV